MVPKISGETQCVGKLVALEGNINTITTQLRLLPHSHMILIVAPLDHYLSEDRQQEPFEARAFVRDVHIALTQRNEVARSFLQSSPSRLVFLNGGSVSARAICIAKISQRLTCGNFAEAETIFHDIVKDGVAGLFKYTNSSKPNPFPRPTKTTIGSQTKLPKRLDLRSRRSATIPGLKDQLENESIIKDNRLSKAQTLRRIRDDSGLQIIHIPGESRTITPEPLAWEFQQGADIVTTVLSVPPRPRLFNQITEMDNRVRPTSQYSGTFGPKPLSSSKPSFYAPRSRYSTQHTIDTDEDDGYFELISEDDENSLSAPQVVYGEACIVDMQSALPTPTTPMRWTRSFGDLLHHNSNDSNSFRHSVSANNLRESFNISRKSSARYSTFERLPKAAFVKASRTTIRRSLNPSTPILGSPERSRALPRILNGCGTEFEEDFESTEPVFDIAEDVIIHFTENSPREIVRSISEYRSGNYPVSPSVSSWPLPTPPCTAPLADDCIDQERSITRRVLQQRVGVDPFCSSSSPVQQEMKRQRASESNIAATNRFLPTPASTTFPIDKGPNEKFCEFSGTYTKKSIDIQNKFRSFLNFRFPEEATVLNQYQNSMMPESGAFWKDMFSSGSSASHKRPAVDQIIAVGCEKGTNDAFRTQIFRQVENIGVKENGESRSGRLDLRFLIVSAMHTFMSQPLLARKDLEPMADPRLLADLIVPHLEQYLATNSLVRFLVLTFPFDQIATVIALRSLLGSDLIKVAGVLDTLSSDPPSFVKPPLSQFHASHHSDDASVATSRRPERSQRYSLKPSLIPFKSAGAEKINSRSLSPFSLFFKADYHLPSTASPAEIQSFLALIRKNIGERLPWYRYNIEQVLPPFPIPSKTVLMKDASTSTDELLYMDSNMEMSQLMVEQASGRSLSSLYDSETSEIGILRSPTRSHARLSAFSVNNHMTCRPISPPSFLLSSSSYSLSDSTIRHIPIAIERQSLPQDFTSSRDVFFSWGQEQRQESDSEYTYKNNTSGSTPIYLDRAYSDTSFGSLDLDLNLEAEEDSDYDEYDRMIMGRYSPMGARRNSILPNTGFDVGDEDLETRAMKGNSRKALKWLGLA